MKSALVNKNLQPLVNSLNSYIRDTYHSVERLTEVHQPLNDDMIPVPADFN